MAENNKKVQEMLCEVNTSGATCRVKICNTSQWPMPAYQSAGAAGVDLHAAILEPMVLEPQEVYAIPTGIFIELPSGYEAQIRARSGLALKHGLTLVNGIGTIDSDYRGEIAVIMMNLKKTPYTVNPGERIAQMVIGTYITAEFEVVETPEALQKTLRGDGGFGHSGK